MDITDIKPQQRAALLALATAKDQSLRRVRGGYAPIDNTAQGPVVTVRTCNTLQCSGLVEYEPPQFPSLIRLSTEGKAIAEQLVASERGKAGAA